MANRREFLTHTAIAGFGAVAAGPLGRVVASDARPRPRKPLKTYRIPHTDLVVSRLAYGSGMLGTDWRSADFRAQTARLIRTAYEQGITFFDHADIYGFGQSEEAFSEVLKQTPGLRKKIVIQSKCGHARADHPFDNSRENIVRSVEASLRRLGTDYLDVLLLHWPDTLMRPQEVAQAFDALQTGGKVRYFGVSNHNPYQIELLKKHVRQPLVANQIHLSLAHWVVQPTPGWPISLMHGVEGALLLDYCQVNEIQVQAYSPLKGRDIGKPPQLLNPAADAGPEVKRTAQLLQEVAKRHEVTPAVIMLAWLLHHPAGIVPISGASIPEHIIENCGADNVELSREEWYRLLEAATAIPSSER